MSIQGIVFILASIPAWIYVEWFSFEAQHSPFGYSELGSVASPIAAMLSAVTVFAAISPVTGIFLLILGFIQRRKKRVHGLTS
jgi:hypothetical protein